MSILTIDPFSLQLDPFPQFEYGTTTEDPFFLNQTYMSNDDMVFCDQLAFSDLDCNAPATNLGNIDMVPTEAHEKQLQHENEPESLELGAAKASSCFIAFFEAIERQNSEMKDVIRRQARRLERLEQDLAQLQVTACVSASIDKGDHESSKNTGVQQLSVYVGSLSWTSIILTKTPVAWPSLISNGQTCK